MVRDDRNFISRLLYDDPQKVMLIDKIIKILLFNPKAYSAKDSNKLFLFDTRLFYNNLEPLVKKMIIRMDNDSFFAKVSKEVGYKYYVKFLKFNLNFYSKDDLLSIYEAIKHFNYNKTHPNVSRNIVLLDINLINKRLAEKEKDPDFDKEYYDDLRSFRDRITNEDLDSKRPGPMYYLTQHDYEQLVRNNIIDTYNTQFYDRQNGPNGYIRNFIVSLQDIPSSSPGSGSGSGQSVILPNLISSQELTFVGSSAPGTKTPTTSLTLGEITPIPTTPIPVPTPGTPTKSIPVSTPTKPLVSDEELYNMLEKARELIRNNKVELTDAYTKIVSKYDKEKKHDINRDKMNSYFLDFQRILGVILAEPSSKEEEEENKKEIHDFLKMLQEKFPKDKPT
jgi:hypothetical protein